MDIVVLFGMTGSGKSYLAQEWCGRRGFHYVNTDVVRKKLAGLKATGKGRGPLNEGIYTSEFSQLTYEAIIERAKAYLEDGYKGCLVIDGSYIRRRDRERLYAALSGSCSIRFVLCSCDDAVRKHRLQVRMDDETAVSDGNWEVYLYQQKVFENPDEISAEMFLELDTDASLEYLISRLEDFLRMNE